MISNQDTPSRMYRVIVAATGSVATIKLLQLVSLLSEWAIVKVLLTNNAKKFINNNQLQQLKSKNKVEIYSDQDEWLQWSKRGDPVLHIELRKWAEVLIIAPLSANTLAKISAGICDNLVTLVCRCWNMKLRKDKQASKQNNEKFVCQKKLIDPIIVCPAMNTMMWQHPVTSQQLEKLKNWGYTIVDPVQKILVCGDQGKGAMADLGQIIKCAKQELGAKREEEYDQTTQEEHF